MYAGAHRVLALVLLEIAAGIPSSALAMDLGAAGSWSTSITNADLISGAGSELQSTHVSGSSEVALEVSATSSSTDSWRIDIRRADSVWDPAIKLWVRRTGGGSGTGSIADGLSWIEVGSTDTAFFSGQGNRTGVPIQLRITGVSLSISPDAYLRTVHYTLVDTL